VGGIGVWGFGYAEALDGCPDERDCNRELADDEPGVDVKHFTAETAKVSVTAGVGRATEPMMGAVHFDDEPERWGEEVGDGVAEKDLATECDAELRA
jgi:hypothetical protein